jgi:D-alanyl-D-alanine carboxypeptidase
VTLQLVQEGKLKLDEKIERWFVNETWFGQLPNAKDITLRMLLNHSSGIPNHAEQEVFSKRCSKAPPEILNMKNLLLMSSTKPLFPAGKGFNYSDTNYILIGLIVEKVAGKTLYEITRRILNP